MFEGERPITTANNLLGEFHLDGIERAKRGEPKIDVTFELDANGILHVSALDITTKAAASVSIQNATGHRSSEDVEAMVAEAERMAKGDAARLQLIEARNELESALYSARDAMRTSGGDEQLQGEVDRIGDWLEAAGQGTPLSALRAKTAELQSALARA